MSLESINKRIKKEICYTTLLELSDEKLMNLYIKCPSVQNEIIKLGSILIKYNDKETTQKIITEYLPNLIPPGTKGVIRGNKFNTIIKNFIISLNLSSEKFEVCFEKKCGTSERPDWYILEKETNKIIIGMNQLDMWKGGQQINRGFKYIENNKHNNEKSKLLCVVCNEIQFKSKKNKTYKLFELGFENDTLCYLHNLGPIIRSYFQLGED